MSDGGDQNADHHWGDATVAIAVTGAADLAVVIAAVVSLAVVTAAVVSLAVDVAAAAAVAADPAAATVAVDVDVLVVLRSWRTSNPRSTVEGAR